MISVGDLLKSRKTLKGNYFAPYAYVQGDFELGLLETRLGARLIALPEVFLQGVYEGLQHELGDASSLVLYNCGRWWGKSFFRRFQQEVTQYYEIPLAQMEMVEFLSCFKQCWKTHGWGTIEFNFDYYPHGLIVIYTTNSPFAAAAPKGKGFACQLEAGILASFFSQLTGENLDCLQTSCESMGAPLNSFILGIQERIKMAKTWLQEGHDHTSILELLCNTQVNKEG